VRYERQNDKRHRLRKPSTLADIHLSLPGVGVDAVAIWALVQLSIDVAKCFVARDILVTHGPNARCFRQNDVLCNYYVSDWASGARQLSQTSGLEGQHCSVDPIRFEIRARAVHVSTQEYTVVMMKSCLHQENAAAQAASNSYSQSCC
jgi:hypothetical protein